MYAHRASRRLAVSTQAHVRYPLFDVPILLFVGAWLLIMFWDAGGTEALIFPGVVGWLPILVALLRVLFRWRSAQARPTAIDPSYRRALVWVWVISALAFAILAGGELFVSRLMPEAWRQSLVKTFHIRRVYREYGP